LTAATGYETNGTARLNEKLGYSYDAGNNLQRRTNATLTQTFTPDAANQLSTATRSGTMTVAGLVTRPATNAAVNAQAATLYADQTFASSSGLTLTNNGTNTFTVIAQSATGLLATNTLNSYLPTTLNFAYDANGNLTNDGVRAFYFDAENQLTNITVAGAWRSEFVYDGLHRRRMRKEYTWTGSAWSLTNETRYVYDGLLILQERDGNNIPVLTYTRGLDLSGSLQGAGGIGGLLALSDQRTSASNPTNYFYHADGSGNVTALLNQRNEVVARYLYDPFGNLLAKSSPMADFNRLRFSSKEWHPQSGLALYEFRAYDPNLQRWLNQDPIGEAGGINLYAFVRNNPLGVIDPYGLDFRFDNSSGPLEVSGPLGYLRGDTALEQLGAGGYNAIPLAGNTAISAVNAVGQASAQAIEGLADFAGWLTEQLGGSSGEADLVRRTVAATSLVLGPKGKPCPQKIRIRHYTNTTNTKGLSGIQASSIIRASDQDRVFAESARRKPLSPREAESTYGLKRGRGQNYVETDVPANQVSKRYNPKTQADELVIKGDVTLDNPSFEKR
jgi:RHS repeat-associated protein